MSGELLLPSALYPHFAISGSPLSGKSTLARQIAEKYDLEYVSTGKIVSGLAKEWPLLSEALSKGETIDSPRIDDAILDALQAIRTRGWIVDGFPRFVGQYLKLFMASGIPLHGFLWCETTRELAIKFAKQRERPDDTIENINRRYQWFHTQTRPVFLYALSTRMVPILNFFNLDDQALQKSGDTFVEAFQQLIPSRIVRPNPGDTMQSPPRQH